MTPITLLLLIPTVRAIAIYRYATINKGRKERPPSPKRDGGASAVQPSSPRPSPSPAAPELAPRPWDPVPGPDATATALLFLPPALSLVQPALYLPALILVLLTPARNSASLPAPPRRLPPTATMTPTTSAASTPRWNRRRRTTGRGPPSPRLRRLHHPQRGGGGAQNTAPCHSQDHADALSGTSAQSSLVVVIVGGGSSGRKRRWWWLPGAEAAAEEAAARCYHNAIFFVPSVACICGSNLSRLVWEWIFLA